MPRLNETSPNAQRRRRRSTISVSRAAYATFVLGAERLGISIARLVELAIEPVLGASPSPPGPPARFTIPEQVYERLSAEAARRGVPRNHLVELALAPVLGTTPPARKTYRRRQEVTVSP
jgi:hypothetical protein